MSPGVPADLMRKRLGLTSSSVRRYYPAESLVLLASVDAHHRLRTADSPCRILTPCFVEWIGPLCSYAVVYALALR